MMDYGSLSLSGRMTVGVGPLRRRPGLVGVLLAIPFIIVILVSSPDMSSENALAERLADLQARLQHLDSLHRARREEVQVGWSVAWPDANRPRPIFPSRSSFSVPGNGTVRTTTNAFASLLQTMIVI